MPQLLSGVWFLRPFVQGCAHMCGQDVPEHSGTSCADSKANCRWGSASVCWGQQPANGSSHPGHRFRPPLEILREPVGKAQFSSKATGRLHSHSRSDPGVVGSTLGLSVTQTAPPSSHSGQERARALGGSARQATSSNTSASRAARGPPDEAAHPRRGWQQDLDSDMRPRGGLMAAATASKGKGTAVHQRETCLSVKLGRLGASAAGSYLPPRLSASPPLGRASFADDSSARPQPWTTVCDLPKALWHAIIRCAVQSRTARPTHLGLAAPRQAVNQSASSE